MEHTRGCALIRPAPGRGAGAPGFAVCAEAECMPSKATAELLAEVQRNVAGLEAFKRWLDGLGTRVIFRNPDDLGASVIDALHKWRNRHPEFGSASRIARLLRPDGLPQLPARADRLDRYSRGAGGGWDGAPVPDRAFVHPTDHWQVSRRAINGIGGRPDQPPPGHRRRPRVGEDHISAARGVRIMRGTVVANRVSG